jgi:hypothetical protein
MIEWLATFSFGEILILMFSVLFFIAGIVILFVKLIQGIVTAIDKLNLKKIGMGGAEFYQDPETGEKKPTRRTRKPVRK